MSFAPTSFRPYAKSVWGGCADFRGAQSAWPALPKGVVGSVVYRSPVGGYANWQIVGVTRNSSGVALASCVIDLFETGSDLVKARTVSGVDGSFTISNPGTGPFYLVAYKAGSPDVAGTTANTIMPTLLVPPAAPTAPVLPQSGSIVFSLSADSLALSDGTAVGSWLDSVNGIDVASSASGGQRPTFKTNLFGGKPGVRFDGSNNWLTFGRPAALTAAIDSQTYTLVVVCRVNGSTGNGCVFGATNTGGNVQMYFADGSYLGRNDNGGGKAAPSTGAGFNVMGSSSAPYAGTFTTARERAWMNGGCVACAFTLAPTTGGNAFSIGAATASGALKANVDVMEIIAWSTELLPLDFKQLQTYLCNKYSQALPWTAASSIDVYDGDSQTAGIGSSALANSYAYLMAQARGKSYGQWDVLGIPGILILDMIPKATEFQSFGSYTGKPVKVAAFEYYNERSTATATLVSRRNSYCSTVRGFANTKLVWGTSLSHAGEPDSNRTAYNSDCVTNAASFCDALASIHTNTFIGISGAADTDANTTYFQDGVHVMDAGQTVLQGIVSPVLNTI